MAMAILVVVTTSTTLIFRGITRAWRSGQLRTERYQQARLLFDLFNRELSSCVASQRYPFIGINAGQGALKTGSQQDELYFVGALPGRSGLVERGYWINDRRQLMCHDEEPADGDVSTGMDEICGTDISVFDVSFFDGTQWVGQWDGRPGAERAGRIPRALHIILSIGHPQSEQFETVVYLPVSESANQPLAPLASCGNMPPAVRGSEILDFRFGICDWEAWLTFRESKIENLKSKIGSAPNSEPPAPSQNGFFSTLLESLASLGFDLEGWDGAGQR
ncbi:MAG: hypothetical protein HYZ92_00525 [Candidatus Omnitrophica bacterium]|nr:hypothetical protein [Candidatus Omnitrophota bacterium]